MSYNPYLYGGNPYQNLAQQQQIQYYQNQLQQLEQQQQAQAQMQNQMQNPVQAQAQPTNGIIGKIITKEDDINPFEVPANNQYGFFPTADMSVIYAKMWDKNGDIKTRTYIEVPENRQENNSTANTVNAVDFMDELQIFKQEIMARFDALENKSKIESEVHES